MDVFNQYLPSIVEYALDNCENMDDDTMAQGIIDYVSENEKTFKKKKI